MPLSSVSPAVSATTSHNQRPLTTYLFVTLLATVSLIGAAVTFLTAARASADPSRQDAAFSFGFYDPVTDGDTPEAQVVAAERERAGELIISSDAHLQALRASESATPEWLHPALTASGQAALSRKQIRFTGRLYGVNITFYDCKDQGFCGGMYNGRKVYQGAAACSWNLPLGTRFYIVGDPTKRTYVCEDRGLLDETWVDVFWHDPRDGWIWQSKVGRYASIEVISLP